MGDRYFDLANFAVNNGLDEERQGGFLAAISASPPARAGSRPCA